MRLDSLPRLIPALVASAVLLVGAGCTKAGKKNKALEQARTYAAAGEYDKAELEFKNVLQLEPGNADALAGLGVMFFEQGRVSTVFPLLSRAKDAQPNNLPVRTKLGMYLLAAGKVPEAIAEAEFVLGKDPKQADAAILLASAATRPEDIVKARTFLGGLASADTAPIKTALALLELKDNKLPAATQLIEAALAQNPKYADGHALASAVNFANKKVPEGEASLKSAADLAPARSIHPLQYARFKAQTGDVATARTVLEGVVKKTPDYLPALIALSQLYAGQNELPKAEETIAKAAARDAMHPEVIVLSARFKMGKGDVAKAVEDLERARNTLPKLPEINYQIGLGYANLGDFDRAIESLQRCLAVYPQHADAVLLLANLHLRKNEAGTTVTLLQNLLQKQPGQIRGWAMLADAHRARNELPAALKVYEQVDKMIPGRPETAHMTGVVQLQLRQPAEARASFNEAIKRDPEFSLALDQLVGLDVFDKKFDDAKARVAARIAKKPDDPELHILLARVHAANKDPKSAELSLKEAIRLRPDSSAPYLLLASLYLGGNQRGEALPQLEQAIAKNPKDLQAMMTAAMLYDSGNDRKKAREYYEKILALNPKFFPALNNLAYIYSLNPAELERAFELAQKARELRPEDPNAADTLGWILFQRRQYAWAATLLQESVEKMPGSGEVQYHYGMSQYMLGNETAAESALQKAVEAKEPFLGQDEAKARLALLRTDADKTPAGERAALAEKLAARGEDPVALARLGRIHELQKDLGKASAAYEAALKITPKNVPLTLRLAQILRARDEAAKAMELLKAARKFAPDDPEVAALLGQLAYASGDHPWSFTLAQEVLIRKPAAADALLDHARAAAAVGRLAEAEASWTAFLKAESASPRSVAARRSLELAKFVRGEPASAALADAVARARTDEPDAPLTLVAVALTAAKNKDDSGARKGLEAALEKFPAMAAARKHLALLLARDPANADKAYELAVKARETLAEDADLRRGIAILLYHKADYNRALSALREVGQRAPKDAEIAYYEALTLAKQKNAAGAAKAAERALGLGLAPEQAKEARELAKPPAKT